MNKDIDEQVVEFLYNQKKHFSKTFFSTREIADAVGLTIYQTRGYLEVLQSSSVVEKINSGRGRSGVWRLL
ncbi:faeA-like family protein [Salmonella enterica subsp. enterica serovar Kisangani]|nr:faeA-like family protein [Salmonella enterica subsp. enterica serovar Kisangani]ECN7770474.1 faeA-like family protein [Salmonella enterica subsp. enterica serovar Enteritidis]ECA2179302.1 faeA-like family protein [Salmonella enterica subsp. enterica serovar Kisangani]EDF0162565.1 faeA-like family protein [Salmonella enterica subsp. enterica serovar Kisangani]EDH6023740.1 faeA-like family protein [Salmonella enterica subsp. enterica serovar Kisangani]